MALSWLPAGEKKEITHHIFSYIGNFSRIQTHEALEMKRKLIQENLHQHIMFLFFLLLSTKHAIG